MRRVVLNLIIGCVLFAGLGSGILVGCDLAGSDNSPEYVGTWAKGSLYIQATEVTFRQYLVTREGSCLSRAWEISKYDGGNNIMYFNPKRLRLGQSGKWHIGINGNEMTAGPMLDSREWKLYTKTTKDVWNSTECTNAKALTKDLIDKHLGRDNE